MENENGKTNEEKKIERKENPVRAAIELFYDLQKLRIATSNRLSDGNSAIILPEDDRVFLTSIKEKVMGLEKDALTHVKHRCEGQPIYDEWIVNQRGVGPTMAAVLLSSIDIHKADTVSKIWAYAGIDVMPDGRGRRRVKGVKSKYNPWLKTKLVGVMADNLMRVATWDSDEQCYVRKAKGEIRARYDAKEIWRRYYDQYRHRKETQIVEVCMGCTGNGKSRFGAEEATRLIKLRTEVEALGVNAETHQRAELEELEAASRGKKCANCNGTGGPAKWGCSDGHRDRAAKRYMIKMFILELYIQWRTLEGLPIRQPYNEQFLGHKHVGGAQW
jgi:hypothetical protein